MLYIVIPKVNIEINGIEYFRDFEYDFELLSEIPRHRALKVYREPQFCISCHEEINDWLCDVCGKMHRLDEWDVVIRFWKLVNI